MADIAATRSRLRRLRIALVIEDVSLGGGQERVLAELAPRLARRHEVHLFCHVVRDVDLSGITVHRIRALPCSQGPRALWFALASTLAVRPREFDVVLSQGGNTLGQNFVLAHTAHRDRRRLRAEIARRFGGGPVRRRAWEWLRDALFIRLERRAALRCRGRIICVSRSVRDYFVREYGLRPDEVRVARNGVDHSVFSPQVRARSRQPIRRELGLRECGFVALFMGGRWFEKALPETIQALTLTEEPARLVVVGRGDTDAFARMATDLGVLERITFVPHVARPQDYYGMADCLVHPDPIEPFGLVALEAAACGLPLLAARTGAALDLVEDGVTGFFIEPEAPAIAAGLDRLARAGDALEEMRRQVHARSLDFTWERQAEQIEEIFLRLAPGGEGEAAR